MDALYPTHNHFDLSASRSSLRLAALYRCLKMANFDAQLRDSSMWLGKIFESEEADGMACFAKRVPAVKKSANQAENNARSRIRMCMMKAIDYMIKHPNAAPEVWNSIESGDMITVPEVAVLEKQLSPQKPGRCHEWKTFGSMKPAAKAWLYLAMEDLRSEVSEELLDKMNDEDPHAISDAFDMHFQVHRLDKIVCAWPGSFHHVWGFKAPPFQHW